MARASAQRALALLDAERDEDPLAYIARGNARVVRENFLDLITVRTHDSNPSWLPFTDVKRSGFLRSRCETTIIITTMARASDYCARKGRYRSNTTVRGITFR